MRLVFIYGAIAAGKLTVARELAALTGLALFHNHLVVDAVAAVFPFGTANFTKLREQWWLAMMREAARAGRSLIFTYAPEATVAVGFPERAREAVEAAGGRVDFVRLTVPAEEQERRLANPDRSAFLKLRSGDVLRELKSAFQALEAAMPPPVLTIDTALLKPAAAARAIAVALKLPSDTVGQE